MKVCKTALKQLGAFHLGVLLLPVLIVMSCCLLLAQLPVATETARQPNLLYQNSQGNFGCFPHVLIPRLTYSRVYS